MTTKEDISQLEYSTNDSDLESGSVVGYYPDYDYSREHSNYNYIITYRAHNNASLRLLDDDKSTLVHDESGIDIAIKEEALPIEPNADYKDFKAILTTGTNTALIPHQNIFRPTSESAQSNLNTIDIKDEPLHLKTDPESTNTPTAIFGGNLKQWRTSTFPNLKCADTGRYECNVCHKRFSQRAPYDRHLRGHTGDRSHECDICHKRFKHSFTLNVHKRIHTGERPYQCNICHKQVTQLGHLTLHMRRHTGEKPFACDTCQRRFNTMGSLIIHERLHTGERPYECDICHKLCICKGQLTLHMRTHADVKPYVCGICPKQYCLRSCFQVHMRTHTGEKPYSCDICHRAFSDYSNYNRHKRIHL